MKIAGLDIGTTGCKCTVFDERGKYLGRAYRDYPVKRAVSGHEVDAAALLEGAFSCIREMAEKYPDIGGVGVTSFGESFVCTDEAGKPLYPVMLYTDPRGGEECRELVERLGERWIAHITGVRPHETYSLPKIMWVKKNCPEIYHATKRIFLMVDFVVYHLTGKAQMDYSLAARTMGFDIRKLCWSREVFEAAEIDVRLMPQPVPAGTVAGNVTAAAALCTGLSENAKVVSISHDQVSAAVGAGAFDGAVAVDGAGTVQCLTPIYDEMPDIDIMYQGYFAVVPYVIPGKYVAYAFSYTGGALIQWCVDTFGQKAAELAAQQGMSVNTYWEQAYRKQKDAPSGLLVLPHFAGAATPYMDTGSRGAILGLTMATTEVDIYRGCMEAVVYEMYLNLQSLKESGVRFTRLHATGGGAHSGEWMQMKADVLNLPIVALKTVDAGTVGSAMLTGVAIGLFGDLEEAADSMVEEAAVYEPRPWMYEQYMQVYEKYKEVYRAVRGLV